MRPPRASLRANSCLRSEISLTYRLEIISNPQHVRLSCLVEFSFISSAGQLWACIPRKPKSWKNDLFVLAKSNFLLIIAVVFRHLTHWANLNAPIYPWEVHQKAHPTSFFETQCMEVALWLGILVFPNLHPCDWAPGWVFKAKNLHFVHRILMLQQKFEGIMLHYIQSLEVIAFTI